MTNIQWSNYNKDLSIKDIAKALRSDFKSILPTIKLSIRVDNYQWWSSINIEIKDWFNYSIYRRDEAEDTIYHTKAASEIKKIIEDQLSSYNYDRWDSMSDYFDVNFYSNITFDYDLYDNVPVLPDNKNSDIIEAEDLDNFLNQIGR